MSAKTDATWEALDTAIKAHFAALWEDADVAEDGDYVGDWAVVAHFGDLRESGVSSSYIVETSSNGRVAPHALRGLFIEGARWLDDNIARLRRENGDE